MKFKQSLRRRIIFSFVFFGALLSLMIVLIVHFSLEGIEDSLVEDALKSEMTYILNERLPQPGEHEHINATMTFYHVDDSSRDLLPEPLRTMSVGLNEFKQDKKIYYLYSTMTDQGQAFLVEDATEFEQRESALHIALTSSVVIAIIIALWLSSWLSAKVISPLSTLAEQLTRLKPGSRKREAIVTRYADDEVGQLAATFDDYQQRMEQFILREQEFTADASHELRTPLAVINGACELLRDNPNIPEQAQRQLQRIERAGVRMSQMLESLLLLARETPTGRTASNVTLQVEEVVLEVVEQQRLLTTGKPIELRCEIINGFTLATSRTALTIVLSNLLRNAINYTDEGSVVVRVCDHRIEIIDSGCGIDPQELPNVFERHYRGQNVQKNGSGIGLSIVKRLCDRLHWQINIDSEPNHGTTVTLIL